jgi:hypothetical protein
LNVTVVESVDALPAPPLLLASCLFPTPPLEEQLVTLTPAGATVSTVHV